MHYATLNVTGRFWLKKINIKTASLLTGIWVWWSYPVPRSSITLSFHRIVLLFIPPLSCTRYDDVVKMNAPVILPFVMPDGAVLCNMTFRNSSFFASFLFCFWKIYIYSTEKRIMAWSTQQYTIPKLCIRIYIISTYKCDMLKLQ